MQAILPPAPLPTTNESISLPIFRRATPASTSGNPATTPPRPVATASVPPAVQRLDKLRLESLSEGDKVVVKTLNSTYNFEIGVNFHCKVVPSKPSARTGTVVLMGGLNVEQTEHTPNRVFIGGCLAYKFDDEEVCILTSPVESIFLVPAKKPAAVA